MRQGIVLILVLTALGCSSGQPPQSLSPVADAAALPSAATVELGDSGHFRFVADFDPGLAELRFAFAGLIPAPAAANDQATVAEVERWSKPCWRSSRRGDGAALASRRQRPRPRGVSASIRPR